MTGNRRYEYKMRTAYCISVGQTSVVGFCVPRSPVLWLQAELFEIVQLLVADTGKSVSSRYSLCGSFVLENDML